LVTNEASLHSYLTLTTSPLQVHPVSLARSLGFFMTQKEYLLRDASHLLSQLCRVDPERFYLGLPENKP